MIRLNSEFMDVIRPFNIGESIRLGSDYDGGYCVPVSAISKLRFFYSYGYGYNFKFEENLIDLLNISVFLYDDEASTRQLFRQLLMSLLFRPFCKSSKYAPRKVLKNFSNYRKMIKNKKIFYSNSKVVPLGSRLERNNKSIIFDETINAPSFEHLNAAIKMDIEGAEYEIFDRSAVNFDKFAIIIVEFHDINRNLEVFNKIVDNLSHHFVISNAHINNYGPISDGGVPSIIELVFANKVFARNYSNVSSIPSPLDRPCCIYKPEIHYVYDKNRSSGAAE
jgi:hypothetical protein